MGVAGSNYGYSLMWVLVVAVLLRFVFVSLIARYQLCNPHGEGVLDGLARLHPVVRARAAGGRHRDGPRVRVVHDGRNGRGVPQPLRLRPDLAVGDRLQRGRAACWSSSPSYERLERVFKFFLAVLSVSFVGSALWVGPERRRASCRASYRFEMPDQQGQFNPLLVAVAMIGAVGGSLMNLAYPYFLEAKGWRGPAVPQGAVLRLPARGHGDDRAQPRGLDAGRRAALSRTSTIKELDDLPRLLSRRPRRRRPLALLPRHLRRHLHVGARPRRRPRLHGHPRLAALAAGTGPIPIRLPRATRSTAGSSSGASSRRWSGRCPACRTS